MTSIFFFLQLVKNIRDNLLKKFEINQNLIILNERVTLLPITTFKNRQKAKIYINKIFFK